MVTSSTDLQKELLEIFGRLSNEQQQAVLEYVHKLSKSNSEKSKEALAKLAGSIDPEDAELMRQAIEKYCKKIDLDGWTSAS